MAYSHHLSVLLLAMLAGCSTVATTPEFQRLELVFSNTQTALPYSIVVAVGTKAPDGAVHEATGEASQGALIRALCRSIQGSLRARGCKATYRDIDKSVEAETPDQKLRRSMRQAVELPEGWTFTYARIDRKIQHDDIGTGKGTGDLLLTMCASR